jgi:intracellular multiplication protein IcmT
MAHFRDTYRPAKFGFLDVRVGVILLVSLVHIRAWTLGLDVVVILVAWYVERIGLGFDGAQRAFRMWFAGGYRPALRTQKIRRRVDYQRTRLAWEKEQDTTAVALDEVKRDNSIIPEKKIS